MPGPVPKSINGFSGGGLNVAKAEPECMALVAAVAVAWTEQENALAHLIAIALGSSRHQSDTVIETAPNRIAQIAIEKADTIRAKLKFAKAVLSPIVHGTEFEGRWANLADEIEKRGRERNSIVHANWHYTDGLPGRLVRRHEKTWEQWQPTDFEAALERFFVVFQATLQLGHDISAAKAAGTITDR